MGGVLLKWHPDRSRVFLVCVRGAICTVCICSTVSGGSHKLRGLPVSQVNSLGLNRVQALTQLPGQFRVLVGNADRR